MFKIIVTVAFCDTFFSNYYSGTALVFSRSVAKGIALATRAAENKSKGAQYTPIIKCVSVMDAKTAKIILREW